MKKLFPFLFIPGEIERKRQNIARQAYFPFLLLLICINIHAQDPEFEWVATTRTGVNGPMDVALDAYGNIYTAGKFEGTVDFDPGAGTYNLTPNVTSAGYVQKLSGTGELEWAIAFGSEASSIAVDDDGFVYVGGEFTRSEDFNPGVGTNLLNPEGGTDFFIVKLDSDANFIWARSAGANNYETCASVTTDQDGNVISAGEFWETVDFDPGPDYFWLEATSQELFIQKLDAEGDFIWAKAIISGPSYHPKVGQIATDGSGNVFITGTFNGETEFDPGEGEFKMTPPGERSAFFLKLNKEGEFIWAGMLESVYDARGVGLTLDPSGNIYASGRFRGTVDLDPGPGIFNRTSSGEADIFLVKLDSMGNFLWGNSLEIEANQWGGFRNSLSTDGVGNLYITGTFEETGDFDPGPGTYYLTSEGIENAFMLKMDSSGIFVWAGSITGLNSTGTAIATDRSGNIHVVGKYDRDTDFDPGEGTFEISGNDYRDAYVLKLSGCNPSQGTDVVTACNSYTWIDGNTYTVTNNTATHIITNSGGCDSVVTLDLSINYASSGTDVVTACDSYTWIDGTNYTESNSTAMHVLTGSNGCDSVVSLDLTINYSGTTSDVISACNAITWLDGNTYTESNNTATRIYTNSNGCDSVVSLDLTINYSNSGTDVITACGNFTWIDGITYTESNNKAFHILSNQSGCDSIVTLDLTLNSVDNGLTVFGNILTANASGAIYRWLDCNNNFEAIEGETGRSFTAVSNGNYAVEVTQGPCTDISSCITISSLEIGEASQFKDVSLFPNPTNGLITVNLESLSGVSLKVYDTRGKVVYHKSDISGPLYQFELKSTPAIYFVEVQAQDNKHYLKLVLE